MRERTTTGVNYISLIDLLNQIDVLLINVQKWLIDNNYYITASDLEELKELNKIMESKDND